MLRYLYAAWFLFFPVFMLAAFHGHVPGSVGPHADAFLEALNKVGFVEPMLIAAYGLGGSALLFRRTAPFGIVVLAGPVAMIFGFHLFHTGLIAWGSIWPIGLAALAWRFRRGLLPLWNFPVIEQAHRPAAGMDGSLRYFQEGRLALPSRIGRTRLVDKERE